MADPVEVVLLTSSDDEEGGDGDGGGGGGGGVGAPRTGSAAVPRSGVPQPARPRSVGARSPSPPPMPSTSGRAASPLEQLAAGSGRSPTARPRGSRRPVFTFTDSDDDEVDALLGATARRGEQLRQQRAQAQKRPRAVAGAPIRPSRSDDDEAEPQHLPPQNDHSQPPMQQQSQRQRQQALRVAERERKKAEKDAEKERRRRSKEMHQHESGTKSSEEIELVIDSTLAVTREGAAIVTRMADKKLRVTNESLAVPGAVVWRRRFRLYAGDQLPQAHSQAATDSQSQLPNSESQSEKRLASSKYDFEERTEQCAALLLVLPPEEFALALQDGKLAALAREKLAASGCPRGSTAHVVTHSLEPLLRQNEQARWRASTTGARQPTQRLPDRASVVEHIAREHVRCPALSVRMCRDQTEVGEYAEVLTLALARKPFESEAGYFEVFANKAKVKSKTRDTGSQSLAQDDAPPSMFTDAVASVSGVGAEYARAIGNLYPSFRALRDAYGRQGQAATSEINPAKDLASGMGPNRRFGTERSGKLMRLLCSDDPDASFA